MLGEELVGEELLLIQGSHNANFAGLWTLDSGFITGPLNERFLRLI